MISFKEFSTLDEAKASAITGTRKIASFDGDNGHTAVVRHSKEYNEYQVHHYKDGKHIGAANISYHDTKADAIQNAKYEVGLNESGRVFRQVDPYNQKTARVPNKK